MMFKDWVFNGIEEVKKVFAKTLIDEMLYVVMDYWHEEDKEQAMVDLLDVLDNSLFGDKATKEQLERFVNGMIALAEILGLIEEEENADEEE